MMPEIFHIGFTASMVQLFAARFGLRDRALRQRYDQLAALPPESFGHHLWQFYEQNQMTMPGRWGAYPYPLIGPHDAHHVLAACDTSYEGEFIVAPFEAGATEGSAADFLISTMLQIHTGMQLDPSVPATRGLFDPQRFFAELARGARVHEDLLAPNWDFWALIELPIAEARRQLGITAGGNVDPKESRWNGKDTRENLAQMGVTEAAS